MEIVDLANRPALRDVRGMVFIEMGDSRADLRRKRGG